MKKVVFVFCCININYLQRPRLRLKTIYENIDGFKIAEEDLKLRGPGELLGFKQSGIPTLRFADLNRDSEILEVAKK